MVTSAPALQYGSLPTPRTRLIGRETERATAHAYLLDDAVPLLTLTGPGGVGKTRLALAIAADVAPQFADGVVWVDLAPLADPELVVTTVATTLGVTPNIDQSVRNTLPPTADAAKCFAEAVAFVTAAVDADGRNGSVPKSHRLDAHHA